MNQESRGLRPIGEELLKPAGSRPESQHRDDTGKALTDESANGEEFDCQICRDLHLVHPRRQDGTVDYSRAVPCQCVAAELEEKRRRNLLKYCELPIGTAHMTFANFKKTDNLAEAYHYAVDLSEGGATSWLTLLSGTGRGKTHLGISAVRRWLQRGIPAKYAYVPLLLEELRRGFRGEGADSYEARFDRFLNVPLLMLDDLGTENPTNWVQEKLDIIVDYRLMNNLALIVTSNTPWDELPFRIVSRLERPGSSQVIYIDAPEYESGKEG
jgi:DNA replication protein DnaC